MGIPFLNALMGYRQGGFDCRAPFGGYTPYYGGGFGGFGGGWAGVFGFRRDPFIPNPYALRDYYGKMAYNAYGMTGLDPSAYRMGECYDYKFNMMNMQLFPENYRAYNFGGKTHFVFNPDAGSYNYVQPYNDVNRTYQRYKTTVEAGTKCHIDLFTKDILAQEALLNKFSEYAKSIEECEPEKAKEVEAKVKKLQAELDKLKDKMDAARALGQPSDMEVLHATDKVLKELRYEFMSDCGQFKGDIDELMKEIEEFKTKSEKSDDTKESEKDDNSKKTTNKKDKNGEKLEKDSFPKVEINTDEQGEEDDTKISYDDSTKTKTLKFYSGGEQVRSVEITQNSKGKVIKEVEKDENGKVVKQIEYDKNGLIQKSFQYTDDAKVTINYKKGDIDKIVEADKTDESKIISEIDVIGKEKGVYYKKTVYNFDGTGCTAVSEFNKDGYQKKRTMLKGTSVISVEVFNYSDDGRKTSIVKYNDAKQKDIKSKIEYEYNKGEKLPSTATEKDKDGNLIAKYEYEYNDDGLVSEEKKTNEDGSYTVTEYEYDERGRVSSKEVTKYDKDGNEI